MHKRFKRNRLRKVADAEENFAGRVQVSRQVVGFLTSGCFSHRFGRGTGCGAVSAEAFGRILHAQSWLTADGKAEVPQPLVLDATVAAGRWALMWARNRTSRVYFPVWVAMSLSDEGLR